MNKGVRDGLHVSMDAGNGRPPLMQLPGQSGRPGTVVDIGTPLVSAVTFGTNTLANTANKMYLSLTYIPRSWVMEEFEIYCGQQVQTTGVFWDIPFYECKRDGLPGRLVANGRIDFITSQLRATGYGQSVRVPESGWYWTGFFHQAGGQVQFGSWYPSNGLLRTTAVTNRHEGIQIDGIPAGFVAGHPPPDLSYVPFLASTSGYCMYQSLYTCPMIVVRGVNSYDD